MANCDSASFDVTFNQSNDDRCTQVSAGGWHAARIDMLEALGHLGQLVQSIHGLFGPAVAAPLREALDDVRGLELGLVDGVIDNEARLRQQLTDLQQNLNRSIAVRDEVLDREAVKDRRLAEAAVEELARARRQNRRLPLWARHTIDEQRGAPLLSWPKWLPERDRQWLRDCEDAITSGWADACR